MKTDLLDIRHADCMDMMREFPDKHFDLAIVDPPYGMGEAAWSGGGVLGSRKYIQAYREKQWDNATPDASFFAELMRVSVNQIVWGGQLLCSSAVAWRNLLG
jgi:site-specific DNA-methyltransferase (adenine-specific)